TSTTICVGERPSLFTQTAWAGAISRGTTRITPGAPVLSRSVEEAPTQTLAHTGSHTINDANADPDDFFTPHSSAAMFLFAYVPAGPIKPHVSWSVFQALSTRAGDEIIDPNSY